MSKTISQLNIVTKDLSTIIGKLLFCSQLIVGSFLVVRSLKSGAK